MRRERSYRRYPGSTPACCGTQPRACRRSIHADWILKTRDKLNRILADNTGKPLEIIERDTDRDNFMSAEDALAYGLIDKVYDKR